MAQTVRPDAQRPNEIVELCARLRRVIACDPAAEAVRAEPDPERDRLLCEYHWIVTRHIREDARVNLAELQELAARVSSRIGFDLTRTPLGVDAFGRMSANLAPVVKIDPYAAGESQEKWWFALHQFYLDGLALADRLLRTEGRRTRAHREWQRAPRYVQVGELNAPGRVQPFVTVAELNFPNLFRVNPFDTYVPTLLHLLAHQVFPSMPFCICAFHASTLGWIRRHGFNRMRGVDGDAACWSGLEHLRDERLFDPRTHRTRHNVIIATSHRFGFLDTPLVYAALHGMPLGSWVNNSFYGPGMAKKVARDRYAIAIRGHHSPSFKQSLVDTADVLVNARAAVGIFADGTQPPIFYGQQMSIRGGLRLAAKAAMRASAGTGRRTYVIPASLNDPVGFIQGRQDSMCCTYHPPILMDAASEPRRAGRSGAAAVVNAGDPLANYLEALFLLNTAQAEHGLPHPRIVAAARYRRRHRHREPLLKRWFQTTLADLAAQAGRP